MSDVSADAVVNAAYSLDYPHLTVHLHEVRTPRHFGIPDGCYCLRKRTSASISLDALHKWMVLINLVGTIG